MSGSSLFDNHITFVTVRSVIDNMFDAERGLDPSDTGWSYSGDVDSLNFDDVYSVLGRYSMAVEVTNSGGTGDVTKQILPIRISDVSEWYVYAEFRMKSTTAGGVKLGVTIDGTTYYNSSFSTISTGKWFKLYDSIDNIVSEGGGSASDGDYVSHISFRFDTTDSASDVYIDKVIIFSAPNNHSESTYGYHIVSPSPSSRDLGTWKKSFPGFSHSQVYDYPYMPLHFDLPTFVIADSESDARDFVDLLNTMSGRSRSNWGMFIDGRLTPVIIERYSIPASWKTVLRVTFSISQNTSLISRESI